MSDAQTNPVRRPSHELFTGDIKMEQKPTIESREDLAEDVVVAEKPLGKDYQDELAFNEEPITIRIERSGEKFAPPVIDCWVNGKGAEVVVNGKWVALGYLPVG